MVRNQPEKRGPDAASRFRALFVKQREVTFVKTLDRGLAKVEKVVCIIRIVYEKRNLDEIRRELEI